MAEVPDGDDRPGAAQARRPETSTTLRRAIAILSVLGSDEAVASGGLTLTRVAQLVGREKSQVSRTLKALWENDFVDRDPDTRAFRIGWRIFTLAARVGEARLLEAAPLVLGRLVHDVGERADLSVLQHSEVLTVLSESPVQTVQATAWVGSVWPAHTTSAGRALLMDLDVDQLGRLFTDADFERVLPNAPHSVEELERRIAASRARGYATTDEELEAGLVGAAAPVRDLRGRIVACVNVSGPKFRFHERLGEAGPRVLQAATELSEALRRPAGPNASRGPRERQAAT